MPRAIEGQHLLPGLSDRVFDSQRVFRAVLEAFSHPGCAVHIPVAPEAPPPVAAASAAFMLSMLDAETRLWVQHERQAVLDYVRFHCGVAIVGSPREADYGLATDAASMPDLAEFEAGDVEYPDRSATLVIQVPRLAGGRRVRLDGPGILGAPVIEPAGLRPDFWTQWQHNQGLFPRGVDVMFVCGASLLALPRTTGADY